MSAIPDSLTEAEVVFLGWLLQEGAPTGLDELCDGHPGLETELRDLHRGFEAVASRTDGAEAGVVERLRSLHGEGEPEAEARPRARRGQYELCPEPVEGDPPGQVAVRDRSLDRILAMRIHGDEGGELRSFLREAAVQARLDHPGVVPVHELGVDGEGRAFCTIPRQRAAGAGNALERVRAGAEGWTAGRAIEVLVQACETLEASHARGIVHGQLSWTQVQAGEYGEVLVAGWGRARAKEDVDVDALALRVHADLSLSDAPRREGRADLEASSSDADPDEFDPSTDVRGLGGMLRELLPVAFPGRSAGPPELAAIARRAMETREGSGYSGVGDVARDLRAYLEMRVVRAHRTGALAELRLWFRRHRTATAIAAACLLLCLACLSWYGVSEARTGSEILELSDAQVLEILEGSALGLWPARAYPDWEAGARAWLERGDALMQRLELHRERLDRLREGRSAPGRAALVREVPLSVRLDREWTERLRRMWRAELERETDLARLGYLRENEEWVEDWWRSCREEAKAAGWDRGPRPQPQSWRIERLAQLVAGLERLALATPDPYDTTRSGPALGTAADVRRALADVSRWRALMDGEATAAWREAMRSIAPPEADPDAFALAHPPRFPLVPLGRGEHGGPWELWDVQSGDRPRRSASGERVLEESSALVFVLLPGGDGVAPFLLSKYEMTQAQWQRFHTGNSFYQCGREDGIPFDVTWLHPAEHKPRAAIEWVLSRLGMQLPTERQWEHAARAVRVEVSGAPAENTGAEEDGWAIHAPVGSFPASALGLHDVLGNVAELCRDGDGGAAWFVRGGDFDLVDARSAAARRGAYEVQSSRIGLRPMLELGP